MGAIIIIIVSVLLFVIVGKLIMYSVVGAGVAVKDQVNKTQGKSTIEPLLNKLYKVPENSKEVYLKKSIQDGLLYGYYHIWREGNSIKMEHFINDYFYKQLGNNGTIKNIQLKFDISSVYEIVDNKVYIDRENEKQDIVLEFDEDNMPLIKKMINK